MTNDHVVPKSFFLDSERVDALHLPQVPACRECNNKKSLLELYVGSAILIASKHPEASRYLREKVRPRLENNRKLWNELNLGAPPQWRMVDGVYQLLHEIRIDPGRTERLLQMIVRGLYLHHFGKVLPNEMSPHVQMVRPEGEAAVWASMAGFFPPGAPRFSLDLGNGNFSYSCVQSPANEGFTAWMIKIHGGVRLHGEDSSADHWWCVTRPTPEAVAADKEKHELRSPQHIAPEPAPPQSVLLEEQDG